MRFTPEEVNQALRNPVLGVRPAGERVPADLHGTLAGEMFADMVRMNDGPRHQVRKAAVVAALDAISIALLTRTSRGLSQHWLNGVLQAPSPEAVTDYLYAVPVCVIGELLGISVRTHTEWVEEVLRFVRCIAPGGTVCQRLAGIEAASRLHKRLREVCQSPGPLMKALTHAFHENGIDEESVVVANAAGLLFQVCEGTSGLIGQSLLRTQHIEEMPQVLIENVLSETPPIRNTRRFPQENTVLKECPFQKGEPIVLPLAHGNAFGQGIHACPGEKWARLISLEALCTLLRVPDLSPHLACYRWRTSHNASVPEFFTQNEKENNHACGHL